MVLLMSITSVFAQERATKEDWKKLELILGLKLPKLVPLDFNKNLSKEIKLLGISVYKRTTPITENSVRKLIDWIISINFEEFINFDKVKNK